MARRSHQFLLLTLVLGCTRKLPPELALPPEEVEAAPVEVADLEEALTVILGGDPLARRIRPLPRDTLQAVDGGEPVADALSALGQLERGVHADRALALQVLERKHRGTAVTALARGYALTLADHELARYMGDPKQPELAAIAPLLTPLLTSTTRDDVVRHPLAFLVGTRSFDETMRRYGDHRVLSGWLDGPGIPLGPVADALRSSSFDALADSGVGKLVMARGRGDTGDAEAAVATLRRATSLYLEEVAADRDSEQTRWNAKRAALVDELGADDPVEALLLRARAEGTAAAADDRAAAAAWLADLALQWRDACSWAPCRGLSRTSDMRQAGSWHPDIDPLADIWRAAALKSAVDSMDVGHDTVAFPFALVDLTDALMGTGASPLTMDLTRRRYAEPKVWGWLTASLGSDEATTWEDARRAIGTHLQRVAQEAAAGAADDAWLQRVAKRAVK
jgi:hypothetical protein